MHGMRRRQVQELAWRCELRRVSSKLELACAEHSFEQLHLQCGLVGGRWRDVQGMRCRQVQERGGIWQLQQLPSSLYFASW